MPGEVDEVLYLIDKRIKEVKEYYVKQVNELGSNQNVSEAVLRAMRDSAILELQTLRNDVVVAMGLDPSQRKEAV